MSTEEKAMYSTQVDRRDKAARLVADCLRTIEKFCQAMPLEWMLGANSATGGMDFAGALLHLLREDSANIQVLAVTSLEQLATRKLDATAWIGFISKLPQAISEANDAAAEKERSLTAVGAGGSERLVGQLPFHKALSGMLAAFLSANVSHMSTDKNITNGRGAKYQTMAAYLNFLVEMLGHPSGLICGGQINLWVTLLRDPQISNSEVLTPLIGRVVAAYMHHMVRIRWEDVEESKHQFSNIIEASWTDEDEYEAWLCDLRSKASSLLRLIGNSEPQMSVFSVQSRIKTLLQLHGNGEPRNHIDPTTNQLTQTSEAILQFEGVHQPLDNILQGLPNWTLRPDPGGLDQKKLAVNNEVRSRISDLANVIVSWNPSDVWLKFRRANLLDALKYYWRHDPTTLLAGVDSLLVYLSVEEWSADSKHGERKLTSDCIGLRKKSGVALVSVSKYNPQHLVPWLAQLSERAKSLLSSSNLLPPNRMHMYEFLSCVATAVEEPVSRADFVSDVLADAIETINSPVVAQALSSVEAFMSFLGISQVVSNPSSATNPDNVKQIRDNYERLFSAFNQLLSVGKRCNEASRKRSNGGIPCVSSGAITGSTTFPDEGPVNISDLAVNDPFVPLWPHILPVLIRVTDVILRLWHPQYQAILLRNPIQRYVFAISDDEAYLAVKQDSSTGGVFGEGGTAGSIVSGWDRRDMNLAPRWSGWLNELRNTSFQLLGLLSAQRVVFAPEMAGLYPELVSVLVEPTHLRAMEHRHFTQYLKQFIEILLYACPATLYQSHLSPILEPLFEHVVYRLRLTWSPVLSTTGQGNASAPKALTTTGCDSAATFAVSGGAQWYSSFYARGGLFVGDLQGVAVEAAVEKVRVEVTRTFSDVLQSALALKGDWALVLANKAKEEQAAKRKDPSMLLVGPNNSVGAMKGGRLNADGSPRRDNEEAIEARKTLRINGLCRFLLLEDERIAFSMTTAIVESLAYPDAFTCRRCTKICHRILESCAWDTRYTKIFGSLMFGKAVKAIVTEPKWMVGTEWDMINLVRDIYVRLVLGQTLLPGGQGPASQQAKDPCNPNAFEQSKNVDKPLLGGGILCIPSDLPRELLASIPSIGVETVRKLESEMIQKRSAKEQKESLRTVLRTASESIKQSEGFAADGDQAIFGRADTSEGLLGQSAASVGDLPETLITASMIRKRQDVEEAPPGYGATDLFP